MKKGVLSLFVLVACLILLSFSVFAAVINVPGDNATIQDAIDSASDGDTINVSGSYNENVVVNKEVEIVGTDAAVDGGSDAAFEIKADNVKIQGFNITTTGAFTGAAVEVYSSDNVEISENNIETSSTVIGIWVCGSNNGCVSVNNLDIKDNNIKINGVSTGIYSDWSNAAHSGWLIQGNEIDSAGVNLELYDVKNVDVKENTFYGNGNSVSVVYSSEFSNVSNADFIDNLFLGNGNIAGVTPSFWIESDFSAQVPNTEVNDVLIQGNEFYNWKNAGIKIGEPGGAGTYNTVSEVLINYNGFNSGSSPGVDNYVDEVINGTFNWWGDCTGPGVVGPGSGNNVSENVTYTPWLGVCISNKTKEPSCVLKTDNVTLRANVSSLVCVDNVRFGININGIWNNYSYTSKLGNTYSFILIPNLLAGGSFVNWTVYADDCYNHTQQDGLESFYVNRRTNLSVILSNPDGLNDWYVSEPEFTLTNLDATNIWYRWDSTGTFLYSSPFGLDDIPNSPPKESAGTLELNWWSDVCANESEQSQLFYVDLVSPQIIDLEPVGIVYNNFRPTIQAYLEEIYQSNSGIDIEIVQMSLSGVDVSSQIIVNLADSLDAIISFTPTSDLAEGKHNVTINVTDNAGRNNQTFWEFYINITPIFDFNVYSPVSQIYGEKRVAFNMSASEELELIEYIDWNDNKPRWRKLCSNCDEYGNKKKKTKSFNDGEHNITIKATDKFEQEKEINVLFEIDSKEPRIIRTEPRRNKITNGSNFYLKYTENNLNQVSVSWNPSQLLADCNESGKNKECYIDLNLIAYDNQYINYWFSVSDFVREVNSSITRIFVDTSSPVLTVNLPNETSYGRLVPFDLEVSEDVKLEYIDSFDFNPRWRTLCTRCDEYNKNKAFSRGNHSISIRALDKAGNSDVEARSFFVSY